ncbi:MAG: hypothetical protein A2008_07655 [Candidatus Wallbacteria bacterium GWC2_49_35]|uniref:TonB C-terminal domain-containing protein n=1 Tax=Candidatus Wallbacteria bacterium GWC2_49_35 TaxID=1817813 RepID=A0A1F7WNW7_9BACT|nr:MAG: hypothetical protein A2008_07655 [Candidatus Wallbacteria bacterium GWC2_49_35]
MIRVKKNYVFLIYLYSFTAHIILIWAGFSCVHAMRIVSGEAAADLSKSARAPFAFKISLTGRRGNSYDESKIGVTVEFDKIKKLISRELPELIKKFEIKERPSETVFEPPDLEPAKNAFGNLRSKFAEMKKAAEDSMKTSEALLAADKKKIFPASTNKKNSQSSRMDRKKKPSQAEPVHSENARDRAKAGPDAQAEVAKSPYTGSGDGTETEVFGNLSGGENSGMRLAGTPDGALDPSIELKSIDLFKSIVGSKIRSKVKYPQNCRRLGIEGSVRIKFEINSGGTAVGIEITRSSGNRDIDAAAVDAVKNGAPFLPYPRDISQKSLSFLLPLNFKLND